MSACLLACLLGNGMDGFNGFDSIGLQGMDCKGIIGCDEWL